MYIHEAKFFQTYTSISFSTLIHFSLLLAGCSLKAIFFSISFLSLAVGSYMDTVLSVRTLFVISYVNSLHWHLVGLRKMGHSWVNIKLIFLCIIQKLASQFWTNSATVSWCVVLMTSLSSITMRLMGIVVFRTVLDPKQTAKC